MPYVTSSRTEKFHLPYGRRIGPKGEYYPDGAVTQREKFQTYEGNQSTYSFRTGKAVDSLASDGSVTDNSDGKDLREQLLRESREARTKFNRPYDTGHEFRTTRSYRVRDWQSWTLKSQWGQYTGPVCMTHNGHPATPAAILPTRNQINLWGAECIKRTIPTSPQAGLSTMLGELREKLPHIPRIPISKKGLSYHELGGEYLNYEFGLAPLARDVKSIVKNLLDANRILETFVNGSGDIRHRRIDLIDETSATTPIAESGGIVYIPRVAPVTTESLFLGSTSVRVNSVDVLHRRVSFSGSYVYFVKEVSDYLGNEAIRYEQMANQLLGTRINAELVWNLTSWSWLFDWAANIGNLISNASAFQSDGLVLRYGYLMIENKVIRQVTSSPIVDTKGDRIGRLTFETANHAKTRYAASPYGFGVNVPDMSPKRWAILAALGMTSAPRNLRLGASG